MEDWEGRGLEKVFNHEVNDVMSHLQVIKALGEDSELQV